MAVATNGLLQHLLEIVVEGQDILGVGGRNSLKRLSA